MNKIGLCVGLIQKFMVLIVRQSLYIIILDLVKPYIHNLKHIFDLKHIKKITFYVQQHYHNQIDALLNKTWYKPRALLLIIIHTSVIWRI